MLKSEIWLELLHHHCNNKKENMASSDDFQAATSQRMYNARAAVYDDSWHPSFARKLLDLTTIHAGDRVLDLACGTGLVTILAAERAGKTGFVLGLDISDGMLEVAKRRCSDFIAGGTVELCHHSITSLATLPQLANSMASFDVITCSSAFVLLNNPVAALATWAQYLKPGVGRLIFDVIPPSNQPRGIMVERAMRTFGVESPYYRAWVTGEQAVRDMVHKASEPNGTELDVAVLNIEDIIFVRQEVWETRSHEASEQAAAKQWEGLLDLEPFATLKTSKAEVRESIRRDFVRQWTEAGRDAGGKVVEVDGVHVAICVRSR